MEYHYRCQTIQEKIYICETIHKIRRHILCENLFENHLHTDQYMTMVFDANSYDYHTDVYGRNMSDDMFNQFDVVINSKEKFLKLVLGDDYTPNNMEPLKIEMKHNFI